mgnify:CR=1 FL=1
MHKHKFALEANVIIRSGTEILKKNDNPSSSLDSRILLGHAMGLDRSIYPHENINITQDEINTFKKLIKERQKGKPVSRIVSKKEFWKMIFTIDDTTLDPRPDSEVIIQTILNHFIDKYHPKTDEERIVSIRVTYKGKRKYYGTNLRLKPSYFEKVFTSKRRSESENKTYNKILSFRDKAVKASEKLPIFTFAKFEEVYFENKEATNDVFVAFDKRIKELKDGERISTAISYECAKKSIQNFKKDLKFADITTPFLTNYETWMLAADRSRTTVGIYLRNLRAIFNRANIDKSLSPFGNGKQKYSIPTGRNTKKALTLEEIEKIFHYQASEKSMEKMAKDYWIFIYLCNGLNVKDLCLLKHKNISDDILSYERAKTKRSKNNGEKITVSLKPQAKEIIKSMSTSP